MDNDVQMFAQVMVIIVSTIAALVAIAGVAKFVFFRRPAKEKASILTRDRLRRLEEAVDAIAVEVERISEGQRFTTKLLAERVPELEARAAQKQPTRAS